MSYAEQIKVKYRTRSGGMSTAYINATGIVGEGTDKHSGVPLELTYDDVGDIWIQTDTWEWDIDFDGSFTRRRDPITEEEAKERDDLVGEAIAREVEKDIQYAEEAFEKDSYIAIQAIVDIKWVAQPARVLHGIIPSPEDATPEQTYSTLEEAYEANIEEATKNTDLGMQVYYTQREPLFYDEDTLTKVYAALIKSHVSQEKGIEIVNAIQNEGIVFRERI